MQILIACEESQRVTTEMRKLGHEAYSCDIEPCSGGHPEWHIQHDVIPILNGSCSFETVDGKMHSIYGKWDMIIAFPPCTYLTSAGTRHYSLKCNSAEKVAARIKEREKAVDFFMTFANADCDRTAIENPVGYMNTHWRKPDPDHTPVFFWRQRKKAYLPLAERASQTGTYKHTARTAARVHLPGREMLGQENRLVRGNKGG